MAKGKLTVSMRDKIVGSAVDAKFAGEEQRLRDRKRTAGDAVYNAIYKNDMEYMNSLKEGWFRIDSDFYLSVENGTEAIRSRALIYSKHHICILMSTQYRLPYDGYVRYIPENAVEEDIIVALDAYDKASDALSKAIGNRKAFARDLYGLLTVYTSVARLKAECPELYGYIESPEAPKNLPCVTYESILSKYFPEGVIETAGIA